MKKYTILLIGLFIISCNKKHDMAMKSANKDLILKVANEYYEKKKWSDALALYDRLPNLVAGTDDAQEVVFKSAYANYYDKNYKLAGHQFKNFSVTFPKDPRAEEAAYMSALCYYEGSMDYNLDQTNTELAITELQEFLNNFPDSERAKSIDKLIQELSYKQEFKAYENARQYYKMGEYKSSTIAFENLIDDFPSSKLRPKIFDFIMKSKLELAIHSVYDLKKERLDQAIAFTKQLEREYPGSESAKNAALNREKLLKEKEAFLKLEKEIEERKVHLTKREEEKEREKKQITQQISDEKAAQKDQKEKAKQATPKPGIITIKK